MQVYRVEIDFEFEGDEVPVERCEAIEEAVLEVIDPDGVGDAGKFWILQGYSVSHEYEDEDEDIPL